MRPNVIHNSQNVDEENDRGRTLSMNKEKERIKKQRVKKTYICRMIYMSSN